MGKLSTVSTVSTISIGTIGSWVQLVKLGLLTNYSPIIVAELIQYWLSWVYSPIIHHLFTNYSPNVNQVTNYSPFIIHLLTNY